MANVTDKFSFCYLNDAGEEISLFELETNLLIIYYWLQRGAKALARIPQGDECLASGGPVKKLRMAIKTMEYTADMIRPLIPDPVVMCQESAPTQPDSAGALRFHEEMGLLTVTMKRLEDIIASMRAVDEEKQEKNLAGQPGSRGSAEAA